MPNSQNSLRSAAEDRTLKLPLSVKVPLLGLFILSIITVMFFARDFLLPVVLAALFALILRPIVRFAERSRIPPAVTSVLLLSMIVGICSFGFYTLSGPVSEWVNTAPSVGAELKRKLASLRQSVETLHEVSEQIQEAAEGGSGTGTQQVVIQEPGLITRAASGIPNILAQILFTFVLLLFFLASGDLFLEKLIHILPRLRDKKKGVAIARDVQSEVSRYLATVSVINVGLGAVIAIGMIVIDMPNPILWGLMAAGLNFIPYIGAIVGIGLVSAAALVTFDTIQVALLAPLIYITATVVEGQFVTPMIVGRRLEINPVMIMLTVAFLAWLWGLAGAFVAVPLLVITSIVSTHVESLAALREILSARRSSESPGNVAEAASASSPAIKD